MPVAVAVSGNEGERYELKSAPPDGFVLLRRLSYGQKMFRQSLLSKAKMEMAGGQNRAERRANANKSFTTELELMNEKVTLFEFANCILDHNLEDLNGQKLDFHNPEHVKMLDGRIGEEINELINDINNFEMDDETGKSK
jgi:hypothetical protein